MITWHPISEAPQTGRQVLLCWSDTGVVSAGHWNADKHAKKPRPFWDCEARSWLGIQCLRNNPPDFWSEISLPASNGPAIAEDWRLAVRRLLASFERLDDDLASHVGLTDLVLEIHRLKRMLGERL